MLRPETFTIAPHTFSRYITAEAIKTQVADFAQHLNAQFSGETITLLPVLSGAFRFAADLLPLLTFPYEINFVKVNSYGNQMLSSEQPKLELGIQIPLQDKHIWLLEDIVDTGLTVDFLVEHIMTLGPKSVQVATMLFKPENHKGRFKPNWIGFDVGKAFVVGYGMDFAEQGRHLRDIYKKI